MKMDRAVWLVCMLVFACSSAGAQTLSPIPPDKFRDITFPFDAKLVNHFFGSAAPTRGEVASFVARGPIALNIYRPAPGVPHGGSVKLSVRSLKGESIAEWIEAVHSFNHPAYLRRLDIAAEREVLVELVVVDMAAGGPSGTPPYTLIVEAWPLSAASTLREAKPSKPMLEQAIRRPDCSVQQSLGVLPEFLEKIDVLDRGDVARALKMVRMVTAGRRLGIQIPGGWVTAGQPVMVSLYAKPVGDGPFMVICRDIAVKVTHSDMSVVGIAPVSDESVWRIEIAAGAQSISSPSLPSVEVIRTKTLASPPTVSHSDAWRHGLAYMCFDRTLNHVVEVPASTAFGGRSRLVVDLSQVSARLTKPQRDELHSVVLQAVYLWVRSCAVCRLDNLILVKIDGRVFAHPGLYGPFGISWGHRGIVRPPPVSTPPVARPNAPPSAPEIDHMLRLGLGSARVGAPIQAQPYREVTQPLTTEFRVVCEAKPDPNRDMTLAAVQRAVCEVGEDASSTANIKVTFNNGLTFCGDDKNIVACRADNELTELNVRDYRFRMRGPAFKSLGTGPIEVDFLHTILHEMGHWIGLQHVDVGESVMASTMEQSRCIDTKTVEGLARRVIENELASDKPAAFRYLKTP